MEVAYFADEVSRQDFEEAVRLGVEPICDENSPEDRELTDYLYGGDEAYRFKQELVLGLGDARMLRELGVKIKKYHMNEGHASLLTVDLLLRFKQDIEKVWDERLVWVYDSVRELCVFTTHTPPPLGTISSGTIWWKGC